MKTLRAFPKFIAISGSQQLEDRSTNNPDGGKGIIRRQFFKLKKLLHKELMRAAEAMRAGTISADEFFPKLVTFLHDHCQNLGLSDRATRYWLYSEDPKDWNEVKDEFKSEEVKRGLLKANGWISQISRKSLAFTTSRKVKVPGSPAKQLPPLSSIMWKYYYRRFEPRPKELQSFGDPIFHKPQPGERTSFDVTHWV